MKYSCEILRSIPRTLVRLLPAIVLALALSLPILSKHELQAAPSHHHADATTGDGHDHDPADAANCCHPPATGCGGFAFLGVETIGSEVVNSTQRIASSALRISGRPTEPPPRPPKRLS